MSSYRKNILVGTLVLCAILVVGWMIMTFSDRWISVFAKAQMTVHFKSTRTDGLSDGSSVTYLGVNVGRVSMVRLSPDGNGVQIDALVNQSADLPANIQANISSSNALGGTASLNLEINGPKAEGQLADGAKLTANYVGLQLNLISPVVTEAIDRIGVVARQLSDSGAISDLDTTIKQFHDTAASASGLINSLNNSVGSVKTQNNLNAIIDNIRATTDNTAKVAEKLNTLADKLSKNSDQLSDTVTDAHAKIDDLAKALGGRLVQISAVLDNARDITDKLDQGKGTMGKLINDPKLYDALVDATRELNATITDLQRLIEQWEQEGVTLKLK